MLCVGFHKTGTSSLGRALELLGYRVAGPFGVRRDLTDAELEAEARRRLERHDAVQDNPWPLLFDRLDEWEPGARFILTVRDADAWWQSVASHFGGTSTPMRERIYGVGDPIDQEARYRSVYEDHNRAVRDHFATRPDDLLELDLGTEPGWEPLCAFLDRPVPDRPFPHANRGTRGRRTVNRWRGRVRRVLSR